MAYLGKPPREEERIFFVQTPDNKIIQVAAPKDTSPIVIATETGGRVIPTDRLDENTRRIALNLSPTTFTLQPNITAPAALTPPPITTAPALLPQEAIAPVEAEAEPFNWNLPLITGAVVIGFILIQQFTKSKAR